MSRPERDERGIRPNVPFKSCFCPNTFFLARIQSQKETLSQASIR